MGEATRVAVHQIIQTFTMVEVALDRQPQPAAYLLGMGQETGSNSQSNQGAGKRREGTAYRWDPNSLQGFRCQGWGPMVVRECPTPASALNQSGGN